MEDEPLIQMLLEEMLGDAACALSAVCSSVEEALKQARSGTFEVALVDLGLSDGSSEPVVRELVAKAIPFAIMSGQARPAFDIGPAPLLPKPFTFAEVQSILEQLANKLPNASRSRTFREIRGSD
ncbi:MAG: response regulator [Erythrobacter sp.]|nr:response regulator [Erythrobacter sp.]